MRALAAGILVPLLAICAAAHAEEGPASPVGLWKTIDDATGEAKSVIKVWEKDGAVYGTVVKLIDPSEPDPVCDKCEGKLRNKPILGMTIMRGLRPDGDEWGGGTILDPENGKTYKVLIQVVEGGRRLKVRGYIGISLLGRTQHWVRVK
jgi:uncharacterized protein (DUF2147 family)